MNEEMGAIFQEDQNVMKITVKGTNNTYQGISFTKTGEKCKLNNIHVNSYILKVFMCE